MRNARSWIWMLALFAIAACAGAPPRAQPRPGLWIDGDVPARELTLAALEALGPRDVSWSHRGATRTFRAVPLEAVLRSAGVEPGEMGAGVPPERKRAGWKYVLVASAADGYQACFSVAELFQGVGRTEAYLAFD